MGTISHRGKHGKSGPLEGSSILRRTICEGNMEKVGGPLDVGSTILLEGDNFMAYYLRGKHGKSGPLQGSTILRVRAYHLRGSLVLNMEKVGHLRVRQF